MKTHPPELGQPSPAESFMISWSLASPTVESILEESLRCEYNGLDGVWFPDYEAPLAKWPELYVTLASLASRTRTVRLGSLITDVLRRHPMVTAHAFASLSQIAPGRVTLGLGAGAGTTQYPFGIKLDHSVGRLAEGIRVIKMLWGAQKEPVSFSGVYFSLKNAQPPMFPHSSIPIYLASYGPKMLELTGDLADGWLPESHTPHTYRTTLDRLRGGMKQSDRNPETFHSCCALIFYPWEPDDKAYSRLLRAAKRYLADYPDIQWAAGYGKDHPGLRTHQIEQDPKLLEELADKVPDSLADATLVYGNEDQCHDRLSKMKEAGCQEAILEPYWIPKEKTLDAVELAGKIKALFEARR